VLVAASAGSAFRKMAGMAASEMGAAPDPLREPDRDATREAWEARMRAANFPEADASLREKMGTCARRQSSDFNNDRT
jgi:hypothetical protein